MLRWGVMCELLPDSDGNKKIRLIGTVYATKEEADAYCKEVRRQNLPYKAIPFQFEDPRDVI